MPDPLTLLPLWLAGAALGAAFFGGLWWTVQRGLTARQPGVWFAGSLLLRMGIVLTGFYLISGAHWSRLLVALAGFVMARFAVIWLTRPSKENRHAPQSR